MVLKLVDFEKAPVADSQKEERQQYRLSAIQVLNQAALQAKSRDLPYDIQNIFSITFENMKLVHEAFNSTTAKMKVAYKSSEINQFADMIMSKIFSIDSSFESRSMNTAFMMMLHEFIFEKQFFRGVRAGTIAEIFQVATLGVFGKWIASVYSSSNKSELLRTIKENQILVEILGNFSSIKSLPQAIKALKGISSTIKSIKSIKDKGTSILSEMNVCYSCYALILYTGAVHLYLSEEMYPTSKDNAPNLAGLKILINVYQSLFVDILFSDKDLRATQLSPQGIISNSQVNLQAISDQDRELKFAFATLQYYNNPSKLNEQNMLVCYDKATKSSIRRKILPYTDLVDSKKIIDTIAKKSKGIKVPSSHINSFVSDISTMKNDPEKCLDYINSKMSEITEKRESLKDLKNSEYADLVFKAADYFKNGSADSKAELVKSVKDIATEKAKSAIENKVGTEKAAQIEKGMSALNKLKQKKGGNVNLVK